MRSHDSRSPSYGNNPEGFEFWGDRLLSETADSDLEGPCVRLYLMLRTDPEQRPSARDLLETIVEEEHESKERDSNCRLLRTCCAFDHDVEDTVAPLMVKHSVSTFSDQAALHPSTRTTSQQQVLNGTVPQVASTPTQAHTSEKRSWGSRASIVAGLRKGYRQPRQLR